MISFVLLAGGSGSRLWPISRQLNPKQFLSVTHGSFSMVQSTVNRLSGLGVSSLAVVCNEEHRFLAAEQLRQLKCEDAEIILESEGRGSAPGVAL
ncbi:mannose-1-phosphate guanylyltransferase/mannose-6-phosphate isomerase, partial [Marinobacter sp. Z-F4-2]